MLIGVDEGMERLGEFFVCVNFGCKILHKTCALNDAPCVELYEREQQDGQTTENGKTNVFIESQDPLDKQKRNNRFQEKDGNDAVEERWVLSQ